MGQHLSDAPRDIAILTFDLAVAGDGPSLLYESSSSICTPSMQFCRPFHSEDMTHFRLSISRPGDIDLSPFDL